MKGIAAISALVLGASAGVPQRTDTAQAAPQQATGVPWAIGERLEYNVKFSLFTVGRASLEVLGIDTVRGVPCWHVLFKVRGKALSYELRDSLQSWFGVADLASRRFVQDTDEDGRMRFRHFEIYPERQQWVRDTIVGDTPSLPLDDASFLFFARTQPFENGQTLSFDRYFIRDRNPVTLTTLQRQNISVPAGRFRTVAVRPVFKSRGLFGQGGAAIVWFSDDAAKIPVRIRTSLSVGTLDISLRSYTPGR